MYYEVFKGKGGKHYWRLKGDNHEIIATSEGYSNQADCEHCITLVKKSDAAPIFYPTHKIAVETIDVGIDLDVEPGCRKNPRGRGAKVRISSTAAPKRRYKKRKKTK